MDRTLSVFLCFKLLVSLCLVPSAIADVEKEIFIAPPTLALPALDAGSHLPHLAPSEHCRNCRAIRSRLNTSFAGDGSEHWVRIDGLQEGKRYEVRICWAGTVRPSLYVSIDTNQLIEATNGLQTGASYNRSIAFGEITTAGENPAISFGPVAGTWWK